VTWLLTSDVRRGRVRVLQVRDRVLAAVVAIVTPAVAPAAAGLSDAAATQACWIRPPYALVKCQSEGGRYPAWVVQGRPVTPDEDSYWSLLPVRYDGIVPLHTVVSEVERVAVAGRFLVARTTKGPVVVVDLDDADGEPVEFATTAAANEFLSEQAAPAVDEGEFRSFESVYQESRPKPSVWARVASVLVAVVLCGAVVLGVSRWVIRRVRSALEGPGCG
jgi:hypothetical protein